MSKIYSITEIQGFWDRVRPEILPPYHHLSPYDSDTALNMIQQLQAELDKLRWIPVSESPKIIADKTISEDILLTDGQYAAIAFYDKMSSKFYGSSGDDDDIINNMGYFTHWMPIPTLPEKDQSAKNPVKGCSLTMYPIRPEKGGDDD